MTRARGKLRCGHNHPKAKLTDGEVDRLRNLYDEGWSYGELATAFEISKGGVAKIVKCVRRAVVPVLTD
jgi:predicted DNA-binding protein YlxM (UPF0122 family)